MADKGHSCLAEVWKHLPCTKGQPITSFRLEIRALLTSSVDKVCLLECRIYLDASCSTVYEGYSHDHTSEEQCSVFARKSHLDDLPQSDFQMGCKCICGFRSKIPNSHTVSECLHYSF